MGRNKTVAKKVDTSSDSDESSSYSDPPPKPVLSKVTSGKKIGKVAKSNTKKKASPSSSESSEDEPPVSSAPPTLPNKDSLGHSASSDEDEGSSDGGDDESTTGSESGDGAALKKTTPGNLPSKKVQAASKVKLPSRPTTTDERVRDNQQESATDESSESSDEEQTKQTPSNGLQSSLKRKADESSRMPPKKAKANDDASPLGASKDETRSIFVGSLSWNVDNDRLAKEFATCGEVVSATVQMDRNTGKSRGFGYVHFASLAAVEQALSMNGMEIDGRAVKIDKSQPVDKGRARENRAKAFGDVRSPPSSTLFVGNLSFGIAEDALWEIFGEYGQVKNVRLPTDRETGRPKGFGYVEFDGVDGAQKAYDAAQGLDVEGRSIRLDFSQPRESNGGGNRGSFGERRGRGGHFNKFGDRGRGAVGNRGGFNSRGGRGSARGGRIAAFEGRKTTFD